MAINQILISIDIEGDVYKYYSTAASVVSFLHQCIHQSVCYCLSAAAFHVSSQIISVFCSRLQTDCVFGVTTVSVSTSCFDPTGRVYLMDARSYSRRQIDDRTQKTTCDRRVQVTSRCVRGYKSIEPDLWGYS